MHGLHPHPADCAVCRLWGIRERRPLTNTTTYAPQCAPHEACMRPTLNPSLRPTLGRQEKGADARRCSSECSLGAKGDKIPHRFQKGPRKRSCAGYARMDIWSLKGGRGANHARVLGGVAKSPLSVGSRRFQQSKPLSQRFKSLLLPPVAWRGTWRFLE